jgi:poly(A) polymerase
MALSRERIADELVKMLGLSDPAPTVAIMLARGIFTPVLPEIVPERLRDLQTLIASERSAGIAPEGLRRLAALLPADPASAERVAARLKLSKRARKRLALAADRALLASPQALAYAIGTESAVDRLLLAGRAHEAAALSSWSIPQLPIGGGALIARGLAPGPEVAATLKRIEQQWIAAGFPEGEAFEGIVEAALRA